MNIKKQINDFFLALPAIWIFSALFLYRSGDKHLVILILISLLLVLYQTPFQTLKEQFLSRRITWFILLSAIISIYYKTTGVYSSGTVRALISLTVYTIIVPNYIIEKLRENLIWLAGLSCAISFLFIYYNSIILGLGRAGWAINAIPFTTFTATAAIISFYFILHSTKYIYKTFSLISTTLGIGGILISETRGTLLAFIITACILSILYIKNNMSNISLKKIIIVSITACIVLFSIGLLNKEKINNRYSQTEYEYSQIENGNLNTSIGYRLQMWHAGLLLAQDPTMLGLRESHIKAKEQLYKEGKIPQNIIHWTHYHNQYLTSFIVNGVIGFLIVLVYFFLPFYELYKKRVPITIQHLAIAIPLVYMIASLTDVPMNHVEPLSFYFILILIITTRTNKLD